MASVAESLDILDMPLRSVWLKAVDLISKSPSSEECLMSLQAGDKSFVVEAGELVETLVAALASNTLLHPHRDLLRRVHDMAQAYPLEMLTPLRPGRKLLVLDLDLTLIDPQVIPAVLDNPQPWEETVARPFLHQFLSAVYPHYDIAIWSATPMTAIKLKLKHLGMLSHDGYKIAFCLDASAMLDVHTTHFAFAFQAKPLAFIWALFKGVVHEGNSVMVDDIRFNFLMNMASGIKIRPCRNLPKTRAEDAELRRLQRYLLHIADKDLTTVCHDEWRRIEDASSSEFHSFSAFFKAQAGKPLAAVMRPELLRENATPSPPTCEDSFVSNGSTSSASDCEDSFTSTGSSSVSPFEDDDTRDAYESLP